MEMKTIIIIFVILLAIGGAAFYFSQNTGMVGKFTEGGGFNSEETNCYDLEDNDNDAMIDCDDPDCDAKACDKTGGCLCTSRQAREVRCWDGKDNDRDGMTDKDDPNCI